MKYIKKEKEPYSLIAKRSTKGSIYDGPQKDWQDKLLKEQGHLCAYCMRRISLERKNGKPCIEIEHYLSRKLHPRLDLRWKNMVGVCNGEAGLQPHCDKTKGKKNNQGIFITGKANGEVKLNILDPLDINKSEKIVAYSLSGKILPNAKDENSCREIIEDIDCILNLNDENLRSSRKQAIDMAKDNLKRSNPTGTWTVKEIEKEIEDWKTRKDGKYRPFCQAAIWFLEYLKSKPVHK
jgi:uncharacterized protein (TIGR02646 family)